MSKFSNSDQKKVNSEFDSIRQGKFSDDDVSKVLDNSDEILRKSENGPLGKFFDDIKTMCAMVKAWSKKQYQNVPYKTIGMIILTLAYVFSPVDIIPDFIPGLGLLDDAAMVGLCLAAARSDINDFRIWASGTNRKLLS